MGQRTLRPGRASEQEREAWREYLDTTRRAAAAGDRVAAARYEEVEPWAWKRLQTTLRACRAAPRP